MIRIFCVLFVLLFSLELRGQQHEGITTFIIVRHAEKADDGSRDPELSAEGVARANKIAAVLKETKIDAVYSTGYKRTRSTVMPVAQAKKLEVQVYDASKVEAVGEMLAKHPGETILVCGHSNTVPKIVNFLIGKEEYENFAEQDYDNLMIVSVLERGKSAKVVWLKY